MTTDAMHRKVNAYIGRIRNAQKHDYANAYADWLYCHLPTGHPEFATEPTVPANLSAMAAQAVRLELIDLIGVRP